MLVGFGVYFSGTFFYCSCSRWESRGLVSFVDGFSLFRDISLVLVYRSELVLVTKILGSSFFVAGFVMEFLFVTSFCFAMYRSFSEVNCFVSIVFEFCLPRVDSM